MTETNKEKITAVKNSEDLEKLKTDYESEIERHKQAALDWKNAAIKKDETILERNKALERLEIERDDWKKEAHSARKTYQAEKKTQQETDFITELAKLRLGARSLKKKKALR